MFVPFYTVFCVTGAGGEGILAITLHDVLYRPLLLWGEGGLAKIED